MNYAEYIANSKDFAKKAITADPKKVEGYY